MHGSACDGWGLAFRFVFPPCKRRCVRGLDSPDPCGLSPTADTLGGKRSSTKKNISFGQAVLGSSGLGLSGFGGFFVVSRRSFRLRTWLRKKCVYIYIYIYV